VPKRPKRDVFQGDTTLSDIFREVDEDVRADRIKELWKTWGSYIVGAAIAIVLGVTFRVFWNEYTDGVQQDESARFDEAVAFVEAGNTLDAIYSLEAMTSATDSGYAILSEFKIAASHIDEGNLDNAIAIYEKISANTSLAKRLRELASYLAAANLMETASPEELILRLAPLAVQGGDWFFSATELLGILALNEGDIIGSESKFLAIQLDPSAPQSLRKRAEEFLDVIESIKPEEILLGDETPFVVPSEEPSGEEYKNE